MNPPFANPMGLQIEQTANTTVSIIAPATWSSLGLGHGRIIFVSGLGRSGLLLRGRSVAFLVRLRAYIWMAQLLVVLYVVAEPGSQGDGRLAISHGCQNYRRRRFFVVLSRCLVLIVFCFLFSFLVFIFSLCCFIFVFFVSFELDFLSSCFGVFHHVPDLLFSSSWPTARPPFRLSVASRPVKQRSAEPRPRWEVLRMLNYLVIALFVCSITYVVFNYRTMSHAESGNGGLFPILVIW